MLNKKDIINEMTSAIDDMYRSIVNLMGDDTVWAVIDYDNVVNEIKATSDYVRDCVADIDSLVKQYKQMR